MRSIIDYGEAAIRESFDALLDSFAKLEYLSNIGLIKKQEICYFRYYINKAAKVKWVVDHLNYYEFQLYGKLHPKLILLSL